jgi:hypothetical protein
MKLNETVLFVLLNGDMDLRRRVEGDVQNWSILCPFRANDTQCGTWCPLFEAKNFADEMVDVVLHCKCRLLNNIPVVEEVTP